MLLQGPPAPGIRIFSMYRAGVGGLMGAYTCISIPIYIYIYNSNYIYTHIFCVCVYMYMYREVMEVVDRGCLSM